MLNRSLQTFAAWSRDRDYLFHSSSGGMFFEFAKRVLQDNGRVVGVIMDGTHAKYVLSDDIEEIKKMRGSKYISSNPAKVIKEIKDCNEKILFTGLPCHVEAVKKSCDTDKIILCNLRCHGLPKNGVFEKHIKKISKGREITKIRFRDKRAGWESGHISQSLMINFSNGETYDKYDQYMIDYMNNKILRDNCKTCQKKNTGDITIGDFWRVPPDFENKDGTSIVEINTKKGKDFFASIDSIVKKRVRFYHYITWRNFIYFLYSSLKKAGLLETIKKIYGGR
mgnify:CR=1 FL=1